MEQGCGTDGIIGFLNKIDEFAIGETYNN